MDANVKSSNQENKKENETGISAANDQSGVSTRFTEEEGALIISPGSGDVDIPEAEPPFFAKQKTIRRASNKKGRWRWILLGFLMLIILTAAGGGVGYYIALRERIALNDSQKALMAATQYQRGVQEQAEGRYEMARKRFEYVIQIDPNFPGVADRLAEVMLAMALEVAPTQAMTPTPEITPTFDNRGEEELFSQAKALLQNKDWYGAIEALEQMRKSNLQYRAVEVDGMYYIALRNRGVDKILKEGNLEGGIYDLTLTERFGPLDAEADGYRTWARLYLNGASFWGVDWAQVVNYFSQVYLSLPNLRDGSNVTASERFREGSLKLAEQLIIAGDYCNAQFHMQNALSLSANPFIEPTATMLAEQCGQGVEATAAP